MKTQKNIWQFYTKDTEKRHCLIAEIECKMPSRTKVWAELQIHLQKPHIESVGYCIKE